MSGTKAMREEDAKSEDTCHAGEFWIILERNGELWTAFSRTYDQCGCLLEHCLGGQNRGKGKKFGDLFVMVGSKEQRESGWLI